MVKRYSGVSWQQDVLKIRALLVMYFSKKMEICVEAEGIQQACEWHW